MFKKNSNVLDFEYSSFPIKIINEKYIEYCDKKYTN